MVALRCSSSSRARGLIFRVSDQSNVLSGLMSVTGVVGPLLMTFLFRFFTREAAPVHFPGAPFLLGAVLALASAGLALRSFRRNPPVESSPAPAAVPAH